MQIIEHIGALDSEGALLLQAASAAGIDAPVPTCPGWRVRDLLAHVHYVHRWAAAYVAEAITEMVPEPDEAELLASAPDDDALLAAVQEGHGALVRALTAAPLDLDCWTFLPAPSPLAMWARRQAHETAVHRVDAELAANRPLTAFDPGFAADGVDELLLGFLGRGTAGRSASTPDGTIGLEAADHPGRWIVRLRGNDIETAVGVENCDLHLKGAAADLYLLLWNRPPRSEPETTGAVELLDAWRERARVSWS